VALCTDVGISASVGAAMLSMLLGLAFLSRQFWGLVADRIGGLHAAIRAGQTTCVEGGAALSYPRAGV
jgi:nitrate/nitrite transporter NarK